MHSPLDEEEKAKIKNAKVKVSSGPTRVSSVQVPASLDLRNYDGQNYITSVKNQGACGSCWSFTTVAFFESAHIRQGQTVSPDFSQQFLLECSGAGTCEDGGSAAKAISFGRTAGK